MLLLHQKRIICFVLALILIVGVSGCASQKAEETESPVEAVIAEPLTEATIETTVPTEAIPEPTETEPEETIPQDVPYTLDELSRAILAFEGVDCFGCGCSFTYCDWDESERIMDTLSEELRGTAGGIYRSECCNSIQEAKSHMAQFFSEDYCKLFDDHRLIEVDGKLYAVQGARGYDGYISEIDESQVTRVDFQTIRVAVKHINSAGDFCAVDSFTFWHNGNNYVISQVDPGPYIGTHYSDRVSQRASMNISELDNGQFLIRVSWASGASSMSRWDYICHYDIESDAFVCEGNGQIIDDEYYDDGTHTENIRQDGLDAVIQMEDDCFRVISEGAGLESCEFELSY